MKWIALVATVALICVGCTQQSNNPATIGDAPARAVWSLDPQTAKTTVTIISGTLSCVGTADTRGISLGEMRPFPIACSDGRTGNAVYTVEKTALNSVTFTLNDGTEGYASIGA